MHKMHPWSSSAIFGAPVCTPMTSIVQKWWHLVVGHTLSYTVSKFEVKSGWQFQSYWWFCTPPVAVQIHTAIMSTSLSASPDMPSMAYQAPVPVPLPTYNWAASDQMWEFCLFKCQLETWTRICKIKAEEKTWLPVLHSGQRGLCHHGRMGTSRWSTQEQPCKVLRLHREHIRWWDLPMSPCLWAGRHHKEVWRIHWWGNRSDMPTCL